MYSSASALAKTCKYFFKYEFVVISLLGITLKSLLSSNFFLPTLLIINRQQAPPIIVTNNTAKAANTTPCFFSVSIKTLNSSETALHDSRNRVEQTSNILNECVYCDAI